MRHPMNKQSFYLSEARSAQVRNAFLTATGITAAHFVTLAFYLYLFKISNLAQFLTLAIISLGLGIVSGIGALLSKRGHPTLGIILVLGAVTIACPFIAGFVSGLGLVIGLALTLIGPMTAFPLLPKKPAWIMAGATLVSGLITLLLDVLGSMARPSLPTIVIQFLAITSIGIFGFSYLRQFRNYSLSTKLISIVAFVFILIAAIQFQVSNLRQRQQLDMEAEERLSGYYQSYMSHVKAESNAVGALAGSIASRPDVQALYLKNDRDGLYALLHPMFENLKDRQISHLYIENPDGTVFLRVHDPKKFGDDITYRGTAADALALRQITSGIEIGPNRLGIRGVAPIYSGNQFIGLIEVGLDYDEQFFTELKELTGADFTLWVTYDSAAVAKLKPGEGIPSAPISEVFYYAGTSHETLPVDPELYRSTLATGKPGFQTVIENTSSPSIVYVAPLLGYKDKSFGVIQVSTSYAQTLQALHASRITSLLMVASLSLLALFLILAATSRFVLKPIDALAQFASYQMSGNTSARVHVHSGDEFEQLANMFNALANSVEEQQRTLEQHVADRTKALATSAEVSRHLSTILNERQLIIEVVERLRAAFDYYHVHIYLLDETSGDLIMAGGTGAVGASLLASGHKIRKGKGLVGRAAETNLPVLVADTSKDPYWLPNPLLPETHSEAALPIAIADQILGVLDVQHDKTNGLKQEDVDLLQSSANQVAIALLNARSYAEAQQRADREARITSIGQKIQSTTSVEAALQVAARELGRTLNLNEIRVILEAPGWAESTRESN